MADSDERKVELNEPVRYCTELRDRHGTSRNFYVISTITGGVAVGTDPADDEAEGYCVELSLSSKDAIQVANAMLEAANSDVDFKFNLPIQRTS